MADRYEELYCFCLIPDNQVILDGIVEYPVKIPDHTSKYAIKIIRYSNFVVYQTMLTSITHICTEAGTQTSRVENRIEQIGNNYKSCFNTAEKTQNTAVFLYVKGAINEHLDIQDLRKWELTDTKLYPKNQIAVLELVIPFGREILVPVYVFRDKLNTIMKKVEMIINA